MVSLTPCRNRFDHHQRGFEETISKDYSIKLSSAGLVYKHYGREVLKNVLSESDETTIETLYWKIYRVCCPFCLISGTLLIYN